MSNENGRSLSTQLEDRGILPAQWHTLSKSLYPGAKPASVLLVWDYCKSRGLDPMKKPAHIVPMEVKQPNGTYVWVDVVLPGIYELRTTAQRTGEYMGHSKPEYGPTIEFGGVQAPEWCEMTMYRWNPKAKLRVEFPVRVYFREVCAVKGNGKANSRWSRAPIQMLTKCTEAAGLREAFPDEIGGEMSYEEMIDQRHPEVIDVTPRDNGAVDLNAELGLTEAIEHKPDEPIEHEVDMSEETRAWLNDYES